MVKVKEEDFINLIQHPKLEKLEEISETFNIFTALDIIQKEIMHSNFLAWLMNPIETHGLGDYFLDKFLKRVAMKSLPSEADYPSIFEIDSWDFNNAEVIREWENIDILIRSEQLKFVCTIENKINAPKDVKQLRRYKDLISKRYPGYRKLFIFLTVERDTPEEEGYIPFSYAEIANIIDDLVKNKEDKISTEIINFIEQYKDMIGRYILENSDVQKICRQIYKKHKKALDLIFEYKPDRQMEIYEYLKELINADEYLILDDSSKSYIRFISKDLDFIPKEGERWVSSGRMLLFEFSNFDDLSLKVVIGPGPQEIREDIYKVANANKKLFNKANRKLTPQFFTIYTYRKKILRKKEREENEIDEIKEKIEKSFNEFKDSELPKIKKDLNKLKG